MATAIHQYEDKLLDFAYGELPAPEASAVESHLKSCARCTQTLDQIRGVRTTMGMLAPEPAPTEGLESLLAYAEQAAARNAAAPSAGVPWWRRVVAPLAGALALTLVAVVAIQTQESGLDLSKQSAVLEAQPRGDEGRFAPAPVAAAPAPAPPAEELAAAPVEPQKIAEKMKSGKTMGAVRGVAESDRKAKEERGWDTDRAQDALAKNTNDGYSQALGATQGPAEERQLAQRKDLGESVGAAQKESKSRREAPSTAQAQDFSNARGGYQANKKADKASNESDNFDQAFGSAEAQKSPTARPAPVLAPPAPKVAQAQPESPKGSTAAPSLGLSMPSTNSPGSGGLGTSRGGGASPSAYKQQAARDSSDDEAAGRGANDLADRKRLSKDVENVQRDQELVARGYLDAARSASSNGNRQEEVRQALSVLATNVQGASRAEALNRLCTALDELGNEGQADQYCAALVREFPKTAAAQLVVTRRNAQRSAPAAKSPAKRSYDAEAAEKKAEPAQAKPADEKPAAAY